MLARSLLRPRIAVCKVGAATANSSNAIALAAARGSFVVLHHLQRRGMAHAAIMGGLLGGTSPLGARAVSSRTSMIMSNVGKLSMAAVTSGLVTPWISLSLVRTKATKAQGTAKNGRDSIGRRLGLKKWPGEHAEVAEIIIRQRGTKWRPGQNVFLGRDHTVHAKVAGNVYFTRAKLRGRGRTWCHILADGNELTLAANGNYVQIPLSWSEEEDQMLVEAVKKHGRDWAVVSKDLGSPEGVIKGKHARHCKNRADELLSNGVLEHIGFPKRAQRDYAHRLYKKQKLRERMAAGGHNPRRIRSHLLEWCKNRKQNNLFKVKLSPREPFEKEEQQQQQQ